MKENKLSIYNKIDQILYSNKEIKDGIKKLAKKLNDFFVGKDVVIIGILKGCLPFMLELIKHLNFDPTWDFMIISSYRGRRFQSEIKLSPKLILDSYVSLKDKHVIVLDDIIDTGKTAKLVKGIALDQKAKEVFIVSLGNKNISEEKKQISPDWFVFEMPLKFLVGFGLDYQEKLRDLKYIASFKDNE